MLYNVRQVKIYGHDAGVFGCDNTKCGSQTATNIHHLLKMPETLVGFNEFISNHNHVVEHRPVEDLIEYGVLGRILICVDSMGPVEWYSSFNY